MSNYEGKKGLEGPKVAKADDRKFLTVRQLRVLLECVEQAQKPKWKRDHCGIYLGFYLGLRCGETVLLDRESFTHITSGQLSLSTLKRVPRIPMQCTCGRRWRASAGKIGQSQSCPRCGESRVVKVPAGKPIELNPPRKSPPAVESRVLDYIEQYLSEMRDDQHWLIEAVPGRRLSSSQLRRVFNHYVMLAGLPPEYSYHSLRHGRGVLIWERFHDHVMVRDSLRQKSLSAAEVYMHLSPERRSKYRDALDEVYEEETT